MLTAADLKQVLLDTTVQGNNTIFPTDAKLRKKVIDLCNQLTKEENLKQRQSYVRVSKDLAGQAYNGKHPRRRKKAKKARKKLQTISLWLIRELRRNFNEVQTRKCGPRLDVFERMVCQERQDQDKIYNLHKQFTKCIAKRKAHQPYDLGIK